MLAPFCEKNSFLSSSFSQKLLSELFALGRPFSISDYSLATTLLLILLQRDDSLNEKDKKKEREQRKKFVVQLVTKFAADFTEHKNAFGQNLLLLNIAHLNTVLGKQNAIEFGK